MAKPQDECGGLKPIKLIPKSACKSEKKATSAKKTTAKKTTKKK